MNNIAPFDVPPPDSVKVPAECEKFPLIFKAPVALSVPEISYVPPLKRKFPLTDTTAVLVAFAGL